MARLHAAWAAVDVVFLSFLFLSSFVLLVKLGKERGFDWRHAARWKWHVFQDSLLSTCLPWVLVRMAWTAVGLALAAPLAWSAWYIRNRTVLLTAWDCGCIVIEAIYALHNEDALAFATFKQMVQPVIGGLGRHNTIRHVLIQKTLGALALVTPQIARGGEHRMLVAVCCIAGHLSAYILPYTIDRLERSAFAKTEAARHMQALQAAGQDVLDLHTMAPQGQGRQRSRSPAVVAAAARRFEQGSITEQTEWAAPNRAAEAAAVEPAHRGSRAALDSSWPYRKQGPESAAGVAGSDDNVQHEAGSAVLSHAAARECLTLPQCTRSGFAGGFGGSWSASSSSVNRQWELRMRVARERLGVLPAMPLGSVLDGT
eukprot:SM000148S01036  [mRNA]  locus=s148:275254:277210:+ [translate_table: standard]